jgi:hypothetical protein
METQMGQELTDAQFSNVSAVCAYLEVPPLSFQEEHFLLLHLRGMSIVASERGAGMSKGRGSKLLKREGVPEVIDYLKHQLFADARITLDTLNTMALEAHRKAQTATEELMAVRDLAKMNMIGGFAPTPVVQKRIEEKEKADRPKDITPKSAKHMEQIADSDLIELAEIDGMGDLVPAEPQRLEEEVIEGDYEEDNENANVSD